MISLVPVIRLSKYLFFLQPHQNDITHSFHTHISDLYILNGQYNLPLKYNRLLTFSKHNLVPYQTIKMQLFLTHNYSVDCGLRMIRHVIVVLFLIAFKVDNVTSNAVDLQYKEEWNSWKQRHNIKYSAFSEELKRYLIWEENKKFIESHNSKNHSSFVLKMNQFGDLVSLSICTFTICTDNWHLYIYFI